MRRRSLRISLAFALSGALAFGGAAAAEATETNSNVELSTGVLEAGDLLDTQAGDIAAEDGFLISDTTGSSVDIDSGTLTVPSSSGDAAVAIGSPVAGEDGDLVSNESVAVEDAGGKVVSTTQLTPAGGRVLVTLLSADSPREYTFPLDLPDGATLTPRGDGGYDVVVAEDDSTSVIGSFDAPWAVDASGNEVATYYTLADGDLVQHVDPNSTATFPVVADPTYSDCGFFACTLFFAKSTTRSMWNKMEPYEGRSSVAIATAFAAACVPVGGVGAVICGGVGAFAGATIMDNLKYAATHNQCFTVQHWRTPTAVYGVGHSSRSPCK